MARFPLIGRKECEQQPVNILHDRYQFGPPGVSRLAVAPPVRGWGRQ
jgi:hypothetical protein